METNTIYIRFKFQWLIILAMLGSGPAICQAQITARLSRGTLTVTGSSVDETVHMGGRAEGEIFIFEASGNIRSFDNVQNIKVDLKKGEDFIRLFGIRIAGSLDVKTGGDFGDVCGLESCLIDTNVTIRGASESFVSNCIIGQKLNIESGIPAIDEATILVQECEVRGTTSLAGSRDADSMVVISSTLVDLKASLGRGNDFFLLSNVAIMGDFSLDGGSGSEDVYAEHYNMLAGAARIRGIEEFPSLN